MSEYTLVDILLRNKAMENSNNDLKGVAEKCVKFLENIGRILYADKELLETAVACLIANGNLLIEGAPGVGKTVLARALARSMGAEFRRMQFTNDLMPADVLGTSIFDRTASTFEFRKGPIFANVFLADEINRANPKTQSALLEAMNEGRVSVDAGTFELEKPFFVLATENPIEYEGTYPLPEAQIDRFLVRLRLGYPSPNEEKKLYTHGSTEPDIANLDQVLTCEEVLKIQEQADNVTAEATLLEYVHEVVSRTRSHPDVELGISPRGGLLWIRMAKARALMAGRTYLIPDDLKGSAVSALAHRINVIVAHDTEGISLAQEKIISDIVGSVEIPS
jgi:MoxR-like ATPase